MGLKPGQYYEDELPCPMWVMLQIQSFGPNEWFDDREKKTIEIRRKYLNQHKDYLEQLEFQGMI